MSQNRSPAVMQQRIEPQLVSRATALHLGLGRYFTGQPCAHGHISERLVANWTCLACTKEKQRAARMADPEKHRERDRQRYWKDPEKSRSMLCVSRLNNVDARRAYDRERYQAADRKAWQKQQALAWAKANPGKRVAIVAARRAWIKLATPAWLTPEQHRAMRDLYVDAAIRKGDWHVDHIIPLRGKLVCGLNVPWNMQVITGDENRQKSNKYGPE